MSPLAIENVASALASSTTQATTAQTPALFSLAGKTVAITGAGRGLGITLAFAIVEARGHAACLDILPEPSNTVWQALTKLANQLGTSATYRRCDVTSEAEVTQALEEISLEGDERGAPRFNMWARFTLFDKLNTYTNSVKDARNKADQIMRELDTLVNLLENLEMIISRLESTTSTALTRNSIQECARAIDVIRSRLGDAVSATSSIRFWTRSRNVIKRLTYLSKENNIKYWKDVLASIQQSLQIALLASQTDQQQRYFTTIQAQLDQLSLNTNAGIQMILDQQRRAQSTAGQIIDQSSGAKIVSHRRHQGSVQSLFRGCDQFLPQNTSIKSCSHSRSEVGRHHDLSYTLLPVSAVGLEEDVTNFQTLERRIRRLHSRSNRNPNSLTSCTCRELHQTKQLIRSPFVMSRNEVHFHYPSCPLWIPGTHDVNFSFGMILCYLILGLKLRVFMTLSIASGTFSVKPSLSAHRIVTLESSPAFKLIDSIFSYPYPTSLVDHSAELTKIFQTRQASPRDRLENGSTLLHYFCDTFGFPILPIPVHCDVDNYRSFTNQLLRYIPYADASDIDDAGRTCLDLVLRRSNVYGVADYAWGSLAIDLLRHDLKISSNGYNVQGRSWVQLPFTEFPDPFTGFSDATVAALLRSEVDFSGIVQRRHPDDVLKQEEVHELYRLTSRMGWARGCQILLGAGFGYAAQMPENWQNKPSGALWHACLLLKALESRNQDMVQFWLEEREHATAECLRDIGDLGRAVVYASKNSQGNIVKMLLTHLVEQRCRLRETTELSGVECACAMRSKALLDTHATCALRALAEHGVKVPYPFRPTSGSIYSVWGLYEDCNSTSDILQTLGLLYESGFTDIAQADVKCCQKDFPLPLHIAIRQYTAYLASPHRWCKFFEMVDWFLYRGANLTDCWPGSRATTVHLISLGAARYFMSSESGAIPENALNRVAGLFHHTLSDGCECSCSTHGCTSITYFCKVENYHHSEGWMSVLTQMRLGRIAALLQSEDKRLAQRTSQELTQCIARAAEGVAQRWIVTEFIRLCVFSWLGIRHTCCDFSTFWDTFRFDLSFQPPLRYPPEELQRVQEEDAYLNTILEDMVPLLDAQYDTHEGDLSSFVDDVLLPEMKTVLDRLKQEDEATYAAGRREMGVLMIEDRESGA